MVMENHDDDHCQSQLPPVDDTRLRRDTAVFRAESNDIPSITSLRDFFREFFIESKKLWYLAGPAIFTSLCQYSLGAVTQLLAGHVGTTALTAISVENNVVACFCFGIMLGMGSALETLCGQAFGARKLEMLGVYMQRSWVILNAIALLLSFLYVFATQLLRLIGETASIAKVAGRFALWMLPQLFAYSVNFPIQKFLQAQSKIMVMAWISATALVAHGVLSWVLMLKMEWGLAGAAVMLNVSWWFIVVAQMVYIMSGSCNDTWKGFSLQAFQSLCGFVRLSLASAVMLCLEVWYFMVLILFAGYLKNAEISVDAMSICMNILGWTIMFAYGMNAAVSVRLSNELGASHPRTAKLTIVVAMITSFVIAFLLSMVLVIWKQYPSLFSTDEAVKAHVKELTPLLALCIIINNVQLVLSGVAVGAGWQTMVAYVNIGCYYLFGVPLGLVLGFKLHLGVTGIWSGMLSGTFLQSCVLIIMVYKTNWNKEASLAENRIKMWGGYKESEEIDNVRNDQEI